MKNINLLGGILLTTDRNMETMTSKIVTTKPVFHHFKDFVFDLHLTREVHWPTPPDRPKLI